MIQLKPGDSFYRIVSLSAAAGATSAADDTGTDVAAITFTNGSPDSTPWATINTFYGAATVSHTMTAGTETGLYYFILGTVPSGASPGQQLDVAVLALIGGVLAFAPVESIQVVSAIPGIDAAPASGNWNTTTPPTTAAIATAVAAAVPNSAQVGTAAASAILATPANKLATNSAGQVTAQQVSQILQTLCQIQVTGTLSPSYAQNALLGIQPGQFANGQPGYVWISGTYKLTLAYNGTAWVLSASTGLTGNGHWTATAGAANILGPYTATGPATGTPTLTFVNQPNPVVGLDANAAAAGTQALAAAKLGSASIFADAGQTVLVSAAQQFTIAFHTQNPNSTPAVPLAIDSTYNSGTGLPYITILQNGAPVDSTLAGLYVEHPGCWGIVVNPNDTNPDQDTVETGVPSRYDVQFTPNSSQSGLFQIVAIAQVNGCEQVAVIATVQVGPVPANAQNLPSEYLTSEERLQLSTLTNGTFGNAALLTVLGTPQQSGSPVTLPSTPPAGYGASLSDEQITSIAGDVATAVAASLPAPVNVSTTDTIEFNGRPCPAPHHERVETTYETQMGDISTADSIER